MRPHLRRMQRAEETLVWYLPQPYSVIPASSGESQPPIGTYVCRFYTRFSEGAQATPCNNFPHAHRYIIGEGQTAIGTQAHRLYAIAVPLKDAQAGSRGDLPQPHGIVHTSR